MTLRGQIKQLESQIQEIKQENKALKDLFKSSRAVAEIPKVKTSHSSLFDKDIELWQCVTSN